jgi:hypothetical protein
MSAFFYVLIGTATRRQTFFFVPPEKLCIKHCIIGSSRIPAGLAAQFDAFVAK